MASYAIQWQNIQDPVNAQYWLNQLEGAIEQVRNSNDSTFNSSLDNLEEKAKLIPKIEPVKPKKHSVKIS